MTITKEQIMKKQSQAPAGWTYDWRYAVYHNEHTLVKRIALDDENYIECRLMYRDEYKEVKNEYGCKWNVATGLQIPTAHISKWKLNNDTGVAVSHGLGKWIDKGVPVPRKNFKILCKIGESITADEIIMGV